MNASTIWFNHLLLAKTVNGPVRPPELQIASEERRGMRDSWHSLSPSSHIVLGGFSLPVTSIATLLLGPSLPGFMEKARGLRMVK